MKLFKKQTAVILAAVMVVSGISGDLGSSVSKSSDESNMPKAKAAAYTPAPSEKPVEWKEIKDVGDLYAIRDDLTANYYLANDIDLSEVTAEGGEYDIEGHGWSPIDGFKGQFDGRGYRIKGMHIYGDMAYRNVGLFGKTENAVFYNLGMVDCDIDVTGANNVGSIVGYASYTEIQYNSSTGKYDHINCYHVDGNCKGYKNYNCYSTGSIIVSGVSVSCIGGLIGGISTRRTCSIYISDSYNTCNIQCVSSKGSYVGGLMGSDENDDVIIKFNTCYNVGKISADGESMKTGAFLGNSMSDYYDYSDCNYDNCIFLTGTAESIQGNSYYSKDSTFKSLTDTQMRNQKLFTGFDFENTWEIDPHCGYGYPQLKANRQVRAATIKVVPSDTAPKDLKYEQGSVLDIEGWKLEVMYEKMAGEPILLPLTVDMLSGYDMHELGKQAVTVTYAGMKSTFEIEVTPISAKEISIGKTDIEIYRGDTYKFDVSFEPENATNPEVKWTSSDEKIVSVDEEGMLTALGKGSATITATSADNEDLKATCKVTVQVAATTIALDKENMTLEVGEEDTLTASLLPLDATEKVKWESDYPNVARVDVDENGNAVVHAIRGGKAVIQASTEKNKLIMTCRVTVHQPESTPTPMPSETPDVEPSEEPDDGQTIKPSDEPDDDDTPSDEASAKPSKKPTDNSKTIIKKIKNTKAKITRITNNKKKAFAVKAKGINSSCKGYQLEYSLKSNMRSPKRKNFYNNDVTVKALKKGKTYYVRVRVYGKVKGKTYYGAWSGKKKIKIKK